MSAKFPRWGEQGLFWPVVYYRNISIKSEPVPVQVYKSNSGRNKIPMPKCTAPSGFTFVNHLSQITHVGASLLISRKRTHSLTPMKIGTDTIFSWIRLNMSNSSTVYVVRMQLINPWTCKYTLLTVYTQIRL